MTAVEFFKMFIMASGVAFWIILLGVSVKATKQEIMTDKEIRALIEKRRKDWRYGNSVEAKYKAEECDDILELMDEQEEHVSEDLEDAAEDYCKSTLVGSHSIKKNAFKAGAEWQKKHLWKPADGDDLPEYEREVVAFQEIFPTDVDVPSLLKIVIAHRPNPEGYDGKSIATGEVEHYTPKTYDKGGWNIPDVKWWLDCSMPKEIEL